MRQRLLICAGLCAGLLACAATAATTSTSLKPGRYHFHIKVAKEIPGYPTKMPTTNDVSDACVKPADVVDHAWAFLQKKLDPIGQCNVLSKKELSDGASWKMDCGGGMVGNARSKVEQDSFTVRLNLISPLGGAKFLVTKTVTGKRVGACKS